MAKERCGLETVVLKIASDAVFNSWLRYCLPVIDSWLPGHVFRKVDTRTINIRQLGKSANSAVSWTNEPTPDSLGKVLLLRRRPSSFSFHFINIRAGRVSGVG